MANHVRYVRRRQPSGVYYYERRVPQAVLDRPDAWDAHFGSQPLFRRSLQTKQQAEAMRMGERAHRDFEMLVGLALGQSLRLGAIAGDDQTRPLTPSILTGVIASVRERTAHPWAQQMMRAELSEADKEELARMIAVRELEAGELRRVLVDLGNSTDPRMPNVTDEVARIVADERLDVMPGSVGWAALSRAVREGYVGGQREIDAMLDGTSSVVPEERLKPRRSAAPRLSEVVDQYIARLQAPRTIREVRTSLASFIDAVGDLRLDEITRAEVVTFCKVEGAKVVGGKSKGSVRRPTSPATLKKKVTLIGSAINHVIETETFDGTNPFSRINVKRFAQPVPKAIMPDKRPFSPHELQLILHHPWFTGCASETNTHRPGVHRLDGMHYWVPILGMYTGCRAGELGGLRVAEVRLDHQHPHIAIQDNPYRTTKGGYRRLVPVLDALLAHGFGDYVEQIARAGHDRLFPDWKPPTSRIDASAPAWSNGRLVRAFNRTVVPQQLRAILTEGTRREVTFHGFRGAFKTLIGRAEYALPDNYKHEVVGHKKSVLDERYVREIPLEETYPAIRQCAYAGLVLPPAPLTRR